jgi:hypothetical protein
MSIRAVIEGFVVEPAFIPRLAALVHEQAQRPGQPCKVRFDFDTRRIGPYGLRHGLWQATFEQDGIATLDYGATLAEAAQRLLDRGQHPEKYPEFTDD